MVFVGLFVYLVLKALNILPVLKRSGLVNANVFSVAEQRQQLSVERAAWGVTLLECSHACRSLCWSVCLGCVVDCCSWRTESGLMFIDLMLHQSNLSYVLVCVSPSKSCGFQTSRPQELVCLFVFCILGWLERKKIAPLLECCFHLLVWVNF